MAWTEFNHQSSAILTGGLSTGRVVTASACSRHDGRLKVASAGWTAREVGDPRYAKVCSDTWALHRVSLPLTDLTT